MPKLTIATCQHPVDADIRKNLRYILRQMETAKQRRAHVVHFSELNLSGYAGVEFESMHGFDWALLLEATAKIQARAKRLKLWVILGSAHQLTGRHKPHNSLYIINSNGEIVDRYDKMFCTGTPGGDSGDLAHYSPGEHFSVFEIRGIRCGALICHDFRYQELYREYLKSGVRLMFHSYHNGHVAPKKWQEFVDAYEPFAAVNHASNVHGVIVPPTTQTYAANNAMWISANNTSARECLWPSFFVRPDGVITGRLQRNRAGVLISTIDTKKNHYDASVHWRDRSMRGVYHSGKLVKDARSKCRTSL